MDFGDNLWILIIGIAGSIILNSLLSGDGSSAESDTFFDFDDGGCGGD